MTTGTAKANGIDIAYETFGDVSKPALLLVMGLGAQMIAWDEDFVQKIVDRGFYVIRYDNRDVGLSSKIEAGPQPDVAAATRGDASSASYTLNEMADDGISLLDALGIAKAHIVGASMGGMIVQAMAIRHPERVLSIASIMSTTGDRAVGQATPEAMAALTSPPPKTREEAVAAAVKSASVVAPGVAIDEAKVGEAAGRAFDRSFYPVGMARQLVAIIASPDRTEALKKVTVPTVVIHGEADALVTPSGGEATAAAIPGAKLVMVPNMGHNLPDQAVPTVVDAIVENTKRA
ncbi:MAG: alpha/beta hydrolase [Tepidiformaceae bacterium]